MCGRYTLATPDCGRLRSRFAIAEHVQIRRRFNIAPEDDVLAVLRRGAQPEGAILRWGLVPPWVGDPRELGVKTINARAETVQQRPAYRAAFADRRCLIVADGFYEWHAGVPHWITRGDGEPFAFAGLWASWRPRREEHSQPLDSCAIVTTAANEAMRDLHDRMPVILRPDDETTWIAPSSSPETLHEVLGAAREQRLVARPVSRAVNDARHDAPDCLDPPEQAALF
jgi:putative SOS response-associated peptidase YedK